MDIKHFNAFCETLPHSTYVVQWGGSHVWKIGGKLFAIGAWQKDQALGVTFKCSPFSYELLREQVGCRPAPYLASRGMKWIQRTSSEFLDDEGLKSYIRASYDLVLAGLSKKARELLLVTADSSCQN